jgi:hypothetical protein
MVTLDTKSDKIDVSKVRGENTMKQQTLSDMEYSNRKKKTKREEFLEIMDDIISWDEWVSIVEPVYPKGRRGRPLVAVETILRMYLLQVWFNPSDDFCAKSVICGCTCLCATVKVIGDAVAARTNCEICCRRC